MAPYSTYTSRGKAMEDAFFHRVDVDLVSSLREELVRDEQLSRLGALALTNEVWMRHQQRGIA